MKDRIDKNEFRKYAVKHHRINSISVDNFMSRVESHKLPTNITPYIIEERPMNVASMDVFSRLMMDRIIFLGDPIYDVTASGITSTWDFATLNKNRIEGPVMDNHFGLLTIDWQTDPVIKMEIIDKYRNSRIEYTIKGSEIMFK